MPKTIENLAAMRQTAGDLLDETLALFDGLLVRHGDRAFVPYGSLPPVERHRTQSGQYPSSRLTCDVALGYLAGYLERGRTEYLDTAFALVRHAFTMHDPDGYFVWNYGTHEIDNVDLGTVLDTYWHFSQALDELPQDIAFGIETSTRWAIGFLKTFEQPDYPGIIQKRGPAPKYGPSRPTADYQVIDVLNGNALAVTAHCRAADLLEDATLLERAEAFVPNLVAAFGRHEPLWWVYTERLDDRSVALAESILYQAMTALYLEPLWRARPSDALRRVLSGALQTLEKVTDSAGELDWSHEARQDFVGTQLLMLPSAAAALWDVEDITSAGRRRIERVAARMIDRRSHHLLNGNGSAADELRQIWAASDLALIILFARRAADAPCPA